MARNIRGTCALDGPKTPQLASTGGDSQRFVLSYCNFLSGNGFLFHGEYFVKNGAALRGVLRRWNIHVFPAKPLLLVLLSKD